jgi:hypothetical protein
VEREARSEAMDSGVWRLWRGEVMERAVMLDTCK